MYCFWKRVTHHYYHFSSMLSYLTHTEGPGTNRGNCFLGRLDVTASKFFPLTFLPSSCGFLQSICCVMTEAENYMLSGVLRFGLWLWDQTTCRKNIDLRICTEVICCESEIAENHSWMKPVLNWFIQQSHKVMNQYF